MKPEFVLVDTVFDLLVLLDQNIIGHLSHEVPAPEQYPCFVRIKKYPLDIKVVYPPRSANMYDYKNGLNAKHHSITPNKKLSYESSER